MFWCSLLSGMGPQKFHLLTSSWSVGEFEGGLGLGDVNLATHSFKYHGSLVDCPAGLAKCPNSAWRQAQMFCLWHCSPTGCGVLVSVPFLRSQTFTAGEEPTQWQHTP